MAINVDTRSEHGTANIRLSRYPDTCPICHRNIEPVDLTVRWMKRSELECVFRCTSSNCQRLFIGRYFERPGVDGLELISCVPWEPKDAPLSKIVTDISPDFAAIFQQAHKTERYKLELAAGPAYRKSLEFLIKDYVSKLHPDPKEVEKIKTMFLGNVIEKYITNNEIKAVAKRAAWLGNDETHYLRTWINKDLQDLKELITLTLLWIEMSERTKKLVNTEMPEA